MGANMVLRLHDKKWDVIAYNRSPEPRQAIARKGVKTANSIPELIKQLPRPRSVWVMVSHGAVDAVLKELYPLLAKGDTIIDGGNSNYLETMRRAAVAHKKGFNYLDAGVSGGPGGARRGACVMVGGEKRVFKKYESLFKAISLPKGYQHMGPSGAGHFVKMVHNGIEYGMMQALAEGFAVMKASPFKLDLEQVTDIYNHGSVIESRLVKWLQNAYRQHGTSLKGISGKVAASGEGLWTVQAGKKLKVPTANIKQALDFRTASQKKPSYTGQVLTALRSQFGGHSKKGDK